ncbi:unnamed protein product [Rhizoctonia solani]|uniref:Uncharacterized protein n=1 Tax=Rhizoctonia solani TaxID=456999 RepID=A0A8H3GJQ5_9AGAM|nr:unnamed protein product [Rhizoctonia solani]
MSSVHRPLSSCSSSSSQSSDREIGSDTTPSPSGGNKSPTFNHRALASRLSMIEASQALAQASDILSLAAQAMSKAAASLAAATGYDCENLAFGDGNNRDAQDWAGSPDWSQSSYNLAPVAIHSDKEIYAADRIEKITEADEHACENQIPKANTENQHTNEPRPSCTVDREGLQGSVAPIEAEQFIPQVTLAQALPGAASCQHVPDAPVVKPLVQSIASKRDLLSENEPDHSARENEDGTVATMSTMIPVTEASRAGEVNPKFSSSHVFTDPSQQTQADFGHLANPTRIVLERGFDVLPALCHITKRRAKTVCIYNYSSITAIISIASMLRANTTLPVIAPESAKQQKLSVAINKFNSSDTGVLFWPGYKKLHPITGLAESPGIQLIQLGNPNPNNISVDVVCRTTTVIMAQSEINQPSANDEPLYTPDILSSTYNEQGPESVLEPLRVYLQARFAKDTYARGFYLDWIVQRRKHNPMEDVLDTARLANMYAEEFLLRGGSKRYGEPVGGQPPIGEAAIRAAKLESAVEAGLILVL